MRFPDDDPRLEGSNGDYLEDPGLDEEFPLGDGTADTETTVVCPYCGETVTIALDAGGGPLQEYVEDCEVCCQPWQVTVTFRGGEGSASVRALDE